jgi:rRNA-processing protein FCF1
VEDSADPGVKSGEQLPEISKASVFRAIFLLTCCSVMLTIDYMKILMDADCLIKLTKAGLKDLVCSKFAIFILEVVKKEVVDAGMRKGCPDATMVEKNINARAISVAEASSEYKNGKEALIGEFQNTKCDLVATDDAKLIRHLTIHAIPFILPGLIVFRLATDALVTKQAASKALKQLSSFISDDEYSTVLLLMEELK